MSDDTGADLRLWTRATADVELPELMLSRVDETVEGYVLVGTFAQADLPSAIISAGDAFARDKGRTCGVGQDAGTAQVRNTPPPAPTEKGTNRAQS